MTKKMPKEAEMESMRQRTHARDELIESIQGKLERVKSLAESTRMSTLARELEWADIEKMHRIDDSLETLLRVETKKLNAVEVHIMKKATTIDEARQDMTRYKADRMTTAVIVTHTVSMTAASYDALAEGLMDDRPGFFMTGWNRIEAPDRETFYVDSQGYDYARYVGLAKID